MTFELDWSNIITRLVQDEHHIWGIAPKESILGRDKLLHHTIVVKRDDKTITYTLWDRWEWAEGVILNALEGSGAKLLLPHPSAQWGYNLKYIARLFTAVHLLEGVWAWFPTVYIPQQPAPIIFIFERLAGVVAPATFNKREVAARLKVFPNADEFQVGPPLIALVDDSGYPMHYFNWQELVEL